MIESLLKRYDNLRKYEDNRYKLPNGKEVPFNEYLAEYVAKYVFLKNDEVKLKDGKKVSMSQFLEEFILSECQKNYNGDIVELLIEKLDYFQIKEYIYKIKDKEIQKSLLEKEIPDEIKFMCVSLFDKEICESYLSTNEEFAKRAINDYQTLWRILTDEIQIPSVILDDKFFGSLIEFSNFDISRVRNYINSMTRICDVTYLDDKLMSMNEKLINSYGNFKKMIESFNLDSEKIQVNKNFLFDRQSLDMIYSLNHQLEAKKFYKSVDSINRKILEIKPRILGRLEQNFDNILTDSLFKENRHNVVLNLKEVVLYNNSLSYDEKVVDSDVLKFYRLIIDMDKLTMEQKLELYNNFKNRKIEILYYDDIRKCKDSSYKKLSKSLANVNNYKANDKLSTEYGCTVYDMRDEKFMMLTRCLEKSWGEHSINVFNESFSLISNDNTKVFDPSFIIYGYSNINPSVINHVVRCDAHSINYGGKYHDNSFSPYVDQILLPNQIVESGNEINLTPKIDDGKISSIKPSYIICIDKIDEKSIEASKKTNLPIVLIKNKILNKNDYHAEEYTRNIVQYSILDNEETSSRTR